jgi:hypothetical protein
MISEKKLHKTFSLTPDKKWLTVNNLLRESEKMIPVSWMTYNQLNHKLLTFFKGDIYVG